MNPQAKAPARGDKAVIHFGLVAVPVTVLNALDDKAGKIARSRFSAAGAPIKNLQVDSATGEIVGSEDVFSRYVAEDGTLVELTDDEMLALAEMENGSCETLGVVSAEDVRTHSAFLGQPVYIRAQTLKVGSKTTRPYDEALALFLRALSVAQQAAVFRYGVRGTVRTVAVFGDGTGVILHSQETVRMAPALPDVESDDTMLAKALGILQKMATPIDSVYPTGAEIVRIREYAEAKAAHDSSEELVLPTVAPEVEPSTLSSLLDMLEDSLL